MELSIALPCFNEEANIVQTLTDLDAWMKSQNIHGNMICVDDGSRDTTFQVLEGLKSRFPNLVTLKHPENIGYGAAVRTGCDAARTEWIAFMDSDRQFHASDFGKLTPFCGEYDIVVGRRRHRADPFLRKVNAKCFGILTWTALGVWVRDVNCAMKIYRRSVWQEIRPTFSTGALFNAELFARARRRGYTWKQVDVGHYPRVRGAQTGARPGVILRMFQELNALCRSLQKEGKNNV